VSIPCFDLEKEKLVINQIGGSLRSPDFELKDAQGRFFKLRPLKKEIHIPHDRHDSHPHQDGTLVKTDVETFIPNQDGGNQEGGDVQLGFTTEFNRSIKAFNSFVGVE
jgi:hypothetical protein